MEHTALTALLSFCQEVDVRFLCIPSSSNIEILTGDLDKVLMNVFSNSPISRSTFDGLTDYYHINSQNSFYYPENEIATHLKRIYTSNYNLNNIVRGDIVVFTSSEVNQSIMSYFLDQVLLYYVTAEQKIL